MPGNSHSAPPAAPHSAAHSGPDTSPPGTSPPGTPSPWITRHCPPANGITNPNGARPSALDLACGGGRHALWLAKQGWQVCALDRDLGRAPVDDNRIEWIGADLENGQWPLIGRQFDLVLVCNYLHRPLLADLRASVRPGGYVIHETFMQGNEAFGRPRSPQFLLRPDELRDDFADWQIITFEQGPIMNADTGQTQAIKQAILARRPIA